MSSDVHTTPRSGEPTVVERDQRVVGGGLRILQFLAGAAGALLFAMGLIAVFRVDFGISLVETSAAVAGFGFSAAMAIAAIVLGGAVMASAFADQDRGGTAFVGLITLLVGIVGLIAEGQIPEEVGVDSRSAALFVGIGAVVFVLALMPWWSRRRVTTVVR